MLFTIVFLSGFCYNNYMNYHIDTGLIYDKFTENVDCPLCLIKNIIEEQILHEYLNDAVMEDDSHILVVKKGFCEKHFDMLFARPNKLSLAIQADSNIPTLEALLNPPKAFGEKKLAEEIDKKLSTCVVCDHIEDSMVKYYKTIAKMFHYEDYFYKLLIASKGFCMKHYAELLRYSSHAGSSKKSYLEILSKVQKRAMNKVRENLKFFCAKHDYRNAMIPLGEAENAIPDAREKLYGKINK